MVVPQVLKHACGSPCYAAPEMLTRAGQQHGYVGHPVDIWSSGVTLFAMLCGYLPFEHANTSSLYKKIIAGGPRVVNVVVYATRADSQLAAKLACRTC